MKSLLERIKAKNPNLEILEENLGEHSGTFAFKTMGFKISGAVTINDNDVKVDADLPFAAMLFKGRIESEVRETMERALNREA